MGGALSAVQAGPGMPILSQVRLEPIMSQMPSPWLLPEPPTPSGVPFRPMGVGEILNGSFTLVRQNPGGTLGLNLVTLTAIAVLGTLGGLLANRFRGWVLLITVVIAWLLISLLASVMVGGLTAAAGRGILGRKVSLREAIRLGRPGWVLLTVWILDLVITVIGAPALIIGSGWLVVPELLLSAWLGVMLSLAVPVVVLERLSPIRAIARSWRLVQGRFWRVLGLFALVGLIIYLAYLALLFPLEILFGLVVVPIIVIGSHVGTDPALLIAGASLLVVVLIAVLSVITALGTSALVVIYTDSRMRREGLDLMLLQAAAGSALRGDEFATVSMRADPVRAPA